MMQPVMIFAVTCRL